MTCEEYLEFQNDRTFHDLGKAWGRTPRQAPSSGQYWRKSGEKWPVLGISWDDAHAYLRADREEWTQGACPIPPSGVNSRDGHP